MEAAASLLAYPALFEKQSNDSLPLKHGCKAQFENAEPCRTLRNKSFDLGHVVPTAANHPVFCSRVCTLAQNYRSPVYMLQLASWPNILENPALL